MQGNEAAQDIARALSLVARRPGVDLAVITRGGGSAEDLWVFNREDLARAILKCPVPVVTAIGHEVDVTVADLAADLRVATPTEAAKRIFFDERPVLESLERGRRRLAELELSRVERERRRLLVFHLGSGVFSRRLSRIQLNAGRAQDRLSTSVRDTLRQKGQALASLAGSVVHPSRRLALMSRQIDGRADLIRKLAEGALERRGRALSIMISRMTRDRVFPFNEKNLKLAQVRLALPSSVRHALAESERSLARTAARLQEANPESPLARGFFILTRGLEGGVVALGNLPEAGETVVARTSGLSLVLQVKESRPDR
jgi:exodeoxyribonuclease VII large subunit